MPNYENNKIRGTLYITVDVKFPKKAFSEEDNEGVTLFLVLWDFIWLCRGVRYTGPVFLALLLLPLSLFLLLLPLSLRSFSAFSFLPLSHFPSFKHSLHFFLFFLLSLLHSPPSQTFFGPLFLFLPLLSPLSLFHFLSLPHHYIIIVCSFCRSNKNYWPGVTTDHLQWTSGILEDYFHVPLLSKVKSCS